MNIKSVTAKPKVRSVIGGSLVVLAGLLLWLLPLGEPFIAASYDYLYRFGAGTVSNRVILIQLDNEAFAHFQQARGEPWDRSHHAELLNRLADDGCALVVIDAFFRSRRDTEKDAALAKAMQRVPIVLMAEQARVTHPDIVGARPLLPAEPFLSAARTNWGVAWLDPDVDGIVRRHWPFPAPGPYPSLAEAAARVIGTKASTNAQFRWLRYYDRNTWPELSYRFALAQPKGFYRNKIVFIGSDPRTSVADGERDEFLDPFSRWSGETTGGVEILITELLNLKHDDWLRRMPSWLEMWVLVMIGAALGAAFWRLRWLTVLVLGLVLMLLSAAAGIWLSHGTNFWFPWLIVAIGQVPVAIVWGLGSRLHTFAEHTRTAALTAQEDSDPVPDIPGYELHPKAFGKGAYGKVWLARKPGGPWEALKMVYLEKFKYDPAPFDREFNGANRYRNISDKHPGLLRVTFVSPKFEDYFYYVMELGDAQDDGWINDPARYTPRDLVNIRENFHRHRLPALTCLRLGIQLCDPLEFLHQSGLTHRDIKPQNILFVNGQPKLADVGLIAEIRPEEQERTLVGTPGYMPPMPERPGTPQADIYSLGMVLYVLNTGSSAQSFPELSSTLIEAQAPEEFAAMNSVIVRACQPDIKQRFQTVAELRAALKEAERMLLEATRKREGGENSA